MLSIAINVCQHYSRSENETYCHTLSGTSTHKKSKFLKQIINLFHIKRIVLDVVQAWHVLISFSDLGQEQRG